MDEAGPRVIYTSDQKQPEIDAVVFILYLDVDAGQDPSRSVAVMVV